MLQKLVILISGILCMYAMPTAAQEVPAETAVTTNDGANVSPEIASDEVQYTGEEPSENAEETAPTENAPTEAASDLQAEENALETPPAEMPSEEPAPNNEIMPEEPVILDVFAPEFMASLTVCEKNQTEENNRVLKIIGAKNEKCRLQYGNYELNIPMTLLSNIHSFDDLEVVLKNQDLAHYNYLPKYVYDGLMYALDSCTRQKDYFGIEEKEVSAEAFITRGINAKYQNNTCFIYLENILRLKFENNRAVDYGYTCKVSKEKLEELTPYFADIVAANPEPEDIRTERTKDVRDADIALMYYLQQNDYCAKNQQENNPQGEE